MKILLIAAVAALVVATASLGAATPIVAKAVAAGTIKTPINLHVKPGAMAVESIKVAPGGSFGWHVHGSAVAVVITGGTLTVFDPAVNGCAPFKVSKGQAFIEPANHPHLARNDGTATVTLYATYLGVPNGVEPNQAATQPAGCNA